MRPLEIKDLYFSYGQRPILKGVDLGIDKGEIITVIGLSGCGKSTLCYCICGIIPHVIEGELSGEVLLHGEEAKDRRLPELSLKVGIVFQNPETQLFSPTVEDEIAFGPENLCLSRQEISKRIDDSLSIVGMQDHRARHPHKLSGGEKQLIAIASVIAMQPDILIFDESLSQIDKQGSIRIKKVIRDLRDMGKSIMMVEHDLKNLDMADNVYLLDSGRVEPVPADMEEEDVFYRT